MAVRETQRSPRRPPMLVAAWLRVPLQVPMIRWALASDTVMASGAVDSPTPRGTLCMSPTADDRSTSSADHFQPS